MDPDVPYLYDRSGEKYPVDAPRWRGNDGTPLMVSALRGIGRDDIEDRERSQWRYEAALPYHLREKITLGEGCTPLLPCHINGADVFVKPEWFNPTSSFKDRGTTVMLSALKDQGIIRVLEDSSGNGGSSVAAYAAAGSMKAKVLVPASTSPAKIVQSRRHGAEIELVPGVRQDTADEAVRQSGSIFYSSHNWHPFFLQGTKLIAYEIWEGLGFTAPDSVVVPAGAGSLVLGCSIGFGELLRAGQIDKMPRILAVQPENCSPIAKAFAAGSPVPVDGAWKHSFAEGASIAHPVRGPEVLAAVTGSAGAIITVTEDQIRAATDELALKGLYAEPTSAMAGAAVPAFMDRGLIRTGEKTVLVLTGSALKATAITE
ncbi:pyridoxal-phosphate dependent enzyme [Paenarthrobacter sp. NPDC056912]|uniref:threonine synthase n=1 Tax=Paenarthrobacter sp. NPDC056912 TaxID=3345965 RepID=UPI00366C6AEB